MLCHICLRNSVTTEMRWWMLRERYRKRIIVTLSNRDAEDTAYMNGRWLGYVYYLQNIRCIHSPVLGYNPREIRLISLRKCSKFWLDMGTKTLEQTCRTIQGVEVPEVSDLPAFPDDICSIRAYVECAAISPRWLRRNKKKSVRVSGRDSPRIISSASKGFI